MVIQFDVDGVLANFLDGYRAVQTQLGIPQTHADTWDGYNDKKVWAVINNSDFFWADLKPLISVDTFYDIRQLVWKHDVYFVTSRTGKLVKRQTEGWLLHHVQAPCTVVISHDKGDFAKAARVNYAIDDKAGNAVITTYVSPKTNSYLINRPYNQFNPDVIGSKVIRVQTVDEFLEDLK